MKGSNGINQKLLSSINASGKLHMVPASLNDRYVIRFCVCAQHATDADVDHAFKVISQFASDLFEIIKMDKWNRAKVEEEHKENVRDVEDEAVDEVFMLDRKKKMSLRYKRSFFVRMVSDPKLYNPKIVRALSTSGTSLNRRHTSEPESDPNVNTYNTPV